MKVIDSNEIIKRDNLEEQPFIQAIEKGIKFPLNEGEFVWEICTSSKELELYRIQTKCVCTTKKKIYLKTEEALSLFCEKCLQTLEFEVVKKQRILVDDVI